ncbi:MAG: alpha/beta hydrolase [Rhodospirillaceae bacterium]
MDDALPKPRTFTRANGATIAYHQTAGKHPGVVFLTGFKSDMTGGKALAVEAFCRARGNAFLRFDYTGHGQSSGRFEDGCIGEWANDAIDAVDSLTEGPQVLVGSSMGGWMMLLVARARPARVAGLVGIAAAPDFTADIIPAELGPKGMAAVERDGFIEVPSQYEDIDPYRITKKLIDDGDSHLLLRQPLAFDGPVRLIHGLKDADVPWRTSLKIMETLIGDDVEMQLVKAGDHRLSEDADLARLTRTLGAVLDGLEG